MKKLLRVLAITCILSLGLSSCKSGELDYYKIKQAELPQLNPIKGDEPVVVIKTNLGDIKLVLYPKEAPKAVENFMTHAKNNYYDNVLFHRVLNEFMIQTGDADGLGGRGGQSIWGKGFENEISPYLYHIRGALAMAKTVEPNSNGSQFYIVQNTAIDESTSALFGAIVNKTENEKAAKDYFAEANIPGYPIPILQSYIENGGAHFLDRDYTVFGHVLEGMDVVDKIATSAADVDGVPAEDIFIETIIIEHE